MFGWLIRNEPATTWVAAFCPMTFLSNSSCNRNNFCISPSTNLLTGMPVQWETMLAISSSPTVSRIIRLAVLSVCPSFLAYKSSSSFNCFCSSGMVPYFKTAAVLRSYSRSAFAICVCRLSIWFFRSCKRVTPARSNSHRDFKPWELRERVERVDWEWGLRGWVEKMGWIGG